MESIPRRGVFFEAGFVHREALGLGILRGKRVEILRMAGDTAAGAHERVASVLQQPETARGRSSYGEIWRRFHVCGGHSFPE